MSVLNRILEGHGSRFSVELVAGQLQGDSLCRGRQQRHALTQKDRDHGDLHGVHQPQFGEAAEERTAAPEPHVLPRLRANLGHQFGGRLHLRGNSELIHSLTERGISGNDNTGINPYTLFSEQPSFLDLRRQADGTFPVGPIVANTSNPFQNAELIKTP